MESKLKLNLTNYKKIPLYFIPRKSHMIFLCRLIFLVIRKKTQLYQRRLEWVKQLQFNTKIRSDKKTYKSYSCCFCTRY